MDHSHMDHGGMDHGGMGDMPMPEMCNMNMLFTWDSTNLCIIFRSWHIRSTFSLIISLIAIVAIVAGYEAVRSASRRYEDWVARRSVELPSESPLFSPFLEGFVEVQREEKASVA